MQQALNNVTPEVNPQKENNAFKIGIIYNGFNADDIAFYKADLIEISKTYGADKLRIIVFGYVPEQDKTDMLGGLEFEYLPPVSEIHWIKQLELANIDLLFVPLINDVFNETTETDAKYLEASVLNIPLLAPEISVYQNLITDQYNGFLYPTDNFKGFLSALLQSDLNALKHCGRVAYERVKQNHTFTPNNIQILEMSLKTADE